ncbi:SNARE-binding exocyst subunit S6 [Coccidioides posadasii str. Silveira]|uniref:Exocyst complex component Sec6 n=1 Tax=Coccidioides posadasii (strain RMSCC 757 / Silveira) TaxID=443226 RepID=E9CW93_COCPS|nr:exocyst complex component Sec6 [Coccidioides posadasii str. Silveira]QVM07041.1 SNARE-binding exocyst subunit S6 [Coccidioides posadasii str. Silveira]
MTNVAKPQRRSLLPGALPSVAQRRAAFEVQIRKSSSGGGGDYVKKRAIEGKKRSFRGAPGKLRRSLSRREKDRPPVSSEAKNGGTVSGGTDRHHLLESTPPGQPEESNAPEPDARIIETDSAAESYQATAAPPASPSKFSLTRYLSKSIRPRARLRFGPPIEKPDPLTAHIQIASSGDIQTIVENHTPDAPAPTAQFCEPLPKLVENSESVSLVSSLDTVASSTNASLFDRIFSSSPHPTITAPAPPMVSQAYRAMASESKEDGGLALPRLEDLLRHAEDLDKIPALKAEYTRKKAAVDAQLRDGLRDQLETVQRSINQLTEGKKLILSTKNELRGIDTLCAESQAAVGDFAQIDQLARIHRNFEATMMMKQGLESFHNDLAEVERMLREDDEDLQNQPNLLNAHMAITRLRDFRDEAMDQISKSQDRSSEATLVEWFQGLDSVIEWFDDHLGTACMNLIPLVQSDNRSMVVRLAVVILSEEKNDAKVQALQDAQKDHQYLATRFKSMNIGPKTVRGYKQNFLKAIELYAQGQFEATKEGFLDDPDKLEKGFKWFFNDLFTVREGMQPLMPKKWKIYKTYTDIYHQMMHDWLIQFVDDDQLPAANMLAIIHWSDKYYTKMAKLGWAQADLTPHVIDDREGELVRDWRNLIIKALDEWIERMFAVDKRSFSERDIEALDTNPDGHFRIKTLGDLWRMLHEQLLAAGASQRTDVAEGVVDAMFRALKSRQTAWQTMLDEECAKYKGADAPPDNKGFQQLQDWLIAVANDQIACIDDNDASGQVGYLTRFRRDFEPLVTEKYLITRADTELNVLRDGYVDLSTHCITLFIDLIFSVDFRTTLPDFFTQKWYGEFAMKRMISTFEDYMTDYLSMIHPSLRDILIEELSDELLVHYLLCIRNRGAKFRRQDPFTEKFKDDILTLFAFFQQYPESFASTIKDRWRLVDWLVRLLEAEKGEVVNVYEGFKREYWDLNLSWVEAVLRSRDDFERSMVSAVKAKAAELSVERGAETIMGRVR